MKNEVTVILLSHKSKKLVLEFLDQIYKNFEIIIIDNSGDISLKDEIDTKYENISLYLTENNGYGAAINYGSSFVKTKYFLISNPDIVGINKEKIEKFVDKAKLLNDKFSVLGPRFVNANPKSHKQSNKLIDVCEMQYISGACMFFNKKNFDKLGGFDENFFLYFEENDFCHRSHKINKNYQINSIKIKHNIGTSVEVKSVIEQNKLDELRGWHFIWSKFYYFRKHYGFLIAVIYFLPTIIRINFRILYHFIIRDKGNLRKYLNRWSGLFSSIFNKSSFKRIKYD